MNKGFIALTLTLSVAGILLALVAVSSLDSALFFDQAMHKEYRALNYYYAGNCIDQALLNFAHDYFYTVIEPQEMKALHCTILSIETQGNQKIIHTRGDLQKSYVYRSITIVLNNDGLEVVKIE